MLMVIMLGYWLILVLKVSGLVMDRFVMLRMWLLLLVMMFVCSWVLLLMLVKCCVSWVVVMGMILIGSGNLFRVCMSLDLLVM